MSFLDSFSRRLAYILAFLLLTTVPIAASAAVAETRSGPVRAFIDLEGNPVGWAISVDGGQNRAEVVEYRSDPQTITKNVSSIKVEDLELTFGMGMAKPWWEWIQAVLTKDPALTRNLAVVSVGSDGQLVDRTVLRQARIKRIEFPTFAGGSKELPYFRVLIAAASSQYEQLDGPVPQLPGAPVTTFQFEWDRGNAGPLFVITPPVVSLDAANDRIGADQYKSTTTVTVRVGNMSLLLARHPDVLRQYSDWFKDTLRGDSNLSKRNAQLRVINANDRTNVLVLHFDQVGLIRIDPYADSPLGPDSAIRVDLFLDRVRLER